MQVRYLSYPEHAQYFCCTYTIYAVPKRERYLSNSRYRTLSCTYRYRIYSSVRTHSHTYIPRISTAEHTHVSYSNNCKDEKMTRTDHKVKIQKSEGEGGTHLNHMSTKQVPTYIPLKTKLPLRGRIIRRSRGAGLD